MGAILSVAFSWSSAMYAKLARSGGYSWPIVKDYYERSDRTLEYAKTAIEATIFCAVVTVVFLLTPAIN